MVDVIVLMLRIFDWLMVIFFIVCFRLVVWFVNLWMVGKSVDFVVVSLVFFLDWLNSVMFKVVLRILMCLDSGGCVMLSCLVVCLKCFFLVMVRNIYNCWFS